MLLPKKLLLLIGLLLILDFSASAQIKAGYLNIASMNPHHPDAQRMNETLNAYGRKLQQEFAIFEKDINTKIQAQEIKFAGAQSTDEKIKIEDEITRLQNDYAVKKVTMEGDYAKREVKLQNQLADSMNVDIQACMDELKLDYLFNTHLSDGVSFVMYAKDEIDVSKSFIKHSEIQLNTKDYTDFDNSASQSRIAYTNLEAVTVAIPAYMNATLKVKDYRKGLEVEVNKKSLEYRTQFEEYTRLKSDASSSAEDIAAMENKLIRLEADYNKMASDLENKVTRYSNEEIGKVLGDIQVAIEAIAKENDLDLVFNQSGSLESTTMLSAHPGNDISYEILEKMGVDYHKPLNKFDFKPSKKVRYVNLVTIFYTMKSYELAMQKLNQMEQQQANKLVELQKQYETLSAQFESETDLTKKKEMKMQLNNIEKEYATINKGDDPSYYNEVAKTIQPVLDEVQAAIDAEAKAQNIDIILNLASTGNILSSGPKMEITQDVIKRMKSN